MKDFFHTGSVIRLLSITGMLVVAAVQVAIAQEARLIEFEMKDQFERVHTQEELVGSVVVFFAADRKGKEFTDRWEDAVRDKLEGTNRLDSVKFARVANVKGVPFFVKGKVKKMFSEDPEKWVLLDWEGLFAQAYGFAKDACTMALFDRNGEFVYKTSATDLDPSKLQDVIDALDGLLGPPTEAPMEPDSLSGVD